jgi:hypothetical protein
LAGSPGGRFVSNDSRPLSPLGPVDATIAARLIGGPSMRRLILAIINGPIWRTFLLMGLFAGASAYASYNLLMLFIANFAFVSQYGFMALKEGGLLQFVQLVIYGYLSVGFYVLFKGCLYAILGRFQLGHFQKH